MNLVVTGQDLAFAVDQLSAVAGETNPSRHRKTAADQGHLVTARHGDEEAAAALGQGRGEFEAQGVVAHEREIFRQSDELGSAPGSEFDLLLGGGEVGVRVRRAGELHRCRQKTTHPNTRQNGRTVRDMPDGASIRKTAAHRARTAGAPP